MNASQALKELKKFSNPERARRSQRYFKTGEGEYGEHDQFIGITIPTYDLRLTTYDLRLTTYD